jgi:hypothetical protein
MWPNLRDYPGITLEGLRKSTKTLVNIQTQDFPNTKQSANHSPMAFGVSFHLIFVKYLNENDPHKSKLNFTSQF